MPNELPTLDELELNIVQKLNSKIKLPTYEDFMKEYPEIKINENKRYISYSYYIYFIQLGVKGPIKIGIITNLKRRFSNIQIYNPYKLKILAVTKGDKQMERMIHKKFDIYKIRGEWFEPAPRLLNYIDKFRYFSV